MHFNELDENHDLLLENFKAVEDEKIQKITKDAEKQDEAIRKNII